MQMTPPSFVTLKRFFRNKPAFSWCSKCEKMPKHSQIADQNAAY